MKSLCFNHPPRAAYCSWLSALRIQRVSFVMLNDTVFIHQLVEMREQLDLSRPFQAGIEIRIDLSTHLGNRVRTAVDRRDDLPLALEPMGNVLVEKFDGIVACRTVRWMNHSRAA